MKHTFMRTGSAVLVTATMMIAGCTADSASEEVPGADSDLSAAKASNYYGPVTIAGPAAVTLGAGTATDSTPGKCTVVVKKAGELIKACVLTCVVLAGGPGSPVAGAIKPTADVAAAYAECLGKKRKQNQQVQDGVKKPEAPQQSNIDWNGLWATARDLPGNFVKGVGIVLAGAFIVLVWNPLTGRWDGV